MHRVKDIVIPDEVSEAMLDAIDKFGVYAYEMNVKTPNIIFVSSCDISGLNNMLEAQRYLNEKCPGFIWVASCLNWIHNAEDILINSVWWEEIHD